MLTGWVRVWFILIYSELAPTDPWCNMLHTLLSQEKYEEETSYEQPLTYSSTCNLTPLFLEF